MREARQAFSPAVLPFAGTACTKRFCLSTVPAVRGSVQNVSEVERARAVLRQMLNHDFEGAEVYRRQLDCAKLTRHESGCRIFVDRSEAAPVPYDDGLRAARLPVEAAGHGKLLVWAHGFDGYLDDLELLNAKRFPDPSTIRVRST